MFHLLLFLLALSPAVVATSPSVAFPLDEQYPALGIPGKRFSWTFSEKTFQGCDSLKYTTSDMPAWMHFSPGSRSFSGTPSHSDEGCTDVGVTAHGCSFSVSSKFSACVLSLPPVTVALPAAEQFKVDNPSLSSVYTIHPNSALYTGTPSLRVPERWSFSVGFSDQTGQSNCTIHYAGASGTGEALPDWIIFDPNALTFNGVAPHGIVTPLVVPLVLFASCEKYYSQQEVPFHLVVATHEVTSSPSNDTLDYLAGSSWGLELTSSHLRTTLVDDRPIQSSDISRLLVDTSAYSWLTFSGAHGHWALSGQPPNGQEFSDGTISLPVVVETTFNQTVNTTISLSMSQSYFTTSSLPALLVGEDRHIEFSLAPYFSNRTESGDKPHLAADYDPVEAADHLKFDGESLLSGTLPSTWSTRQITVTFTASFDTSNSSSRATLPITFTLDDHETFDNTHRPMSASQRRKLILGVSIGVGTLCGIFLLGVLLACFRRWARVEDTALLGEDGRSAWSEKDRKWYGLNGDTLRGKRGSDMGSDAQSNPGASPSPDVPRPKPDYGNLGLRRVVERSHSGTTEGSPGFMRKREFMTRIRETVRNVSDRYAHAIRRVSPPKAGHPFISKPILISPSRVSDLPLQNAPEGITAHESTSSVMLPYTSAPAVKLNTAGVPENRLSRQDSTSSLESNGSVVTHAAEAVIQRAARAVSIRSARSTSGVSAVSDIFPRGTPQRPRLVPFTSASRVPPPRISPDRASLDDNAVAYARVASQTAIPLADDRVVQSKSDEELSMGLHYARALGVEEPVDAVPSSLTVSTNIRSSFSSLESSHQDHANSDAIVRMLVRVGEQFKFRVKLRTLPNGSYKSRKLIARLISGEVLPDFLRVDLVGNKSNGVVEFYGVPSIRDVGLLNVGVYCSDDGSCVARVLLETISRQ